jgi:hypothetical protein
VIWGYQCVANMLPGIHACLPQQLFNCSFRCSQKIVGVLPETIPHHSKEQMTGKHRDSLDGNLCHDHQTLFVTVTNCGFAVLLQPFKEQCAQNASPAA